jgi:hypothetical protein
MQLRMTVLLDRPMIRYALATYGPRPASSEDWQQHPQIRTQLVLTKHFADRQGIAVFGVAFDYHRAPRCLDDLPRLKQALARAKQTSEKVMVDCVGRILRAAKPEHRGHLLNELRAHGAWLHCGYSKAALCDIEDHEINAMLCLPNLERALAHAASRKFRLNRSRTESARSQSSATRRNKSQFAGRRLEQIRAELQAAGKRGSAVEVADLANQRGLRTQRRTEWTAANVRKVLRRDDRAQPPGGAPADNPTNVSS